MSVLSPFDIRKILKNSRNDQPVDDLRMIDSWTEYPEGQDENMRPLNYLCYEMEVIDPETGEKQHLYKALKFCRILRLPRDAKESLSFMDMQSQILSSVWENKYNLVTIIANILQPEPLGLLYLYGVQGVAHTLDEAKAKADHDFVGLTAVLQGTFRVLHFKNIIAREAEWLREKMSSMQCMTVVRGIPKANQGGENAGNKGVGNTNLNPGSQGTMEEIIAGMVDYEYVIQVLSSPVYMDTLRAWQTRTQQDMTLWNGQLQGTKAISASVSLPMMYMANASTAQGWSHAYTNAESVSLSSGQSFTNSFGQSIGQSLSRSFGESFTKTQGLSVTDSVSRTASVSHGTSVGSSFGQSLGRSTNFGVNSNLGLSQNVGSNQSVSKGSSINDSTSLNHSRSQSIGNSATNGATSTVGKTLSGGTSQNAGLNAGVNENVNFNENYNDSNSTNQSNSDSSQNSTSVGGGRQTGSNSSGGVLFFSTGSNSSTSWNFSNSWGNTHSESNGTGTNNGHGFGVSKGDGFSFGGSVGAGVNESESNSGSLSRSNSISGSVTNGLSDSFGTSHSVGSNIGESYGLSQSYGLSNSQGISQGTGVTSSANLGSSFNESVTESNGISVGKSVGHSQSESYGQSSSVGTSQSATESSSVSNGTSVSKGTSASKSLSDGTSGTYSAGTSGSMGIAPSLGYNKSYQWLDQQVKDILELLEFQNERIKYALRGGGAFYTYVYIACESKMALSAAQALAKSTWQNEFAMIQPVQVLDLSQEEQTHLLYHFAAFSADVTRTDVAGASEYKYSTVLLPKEFVAYTHLPRISEGGIYAEVNDVPKFAAPSMLSGEIYMGSIISSERYSYQNGYITSRDYRISESELMHGFFTGASRSGKTVAAMRFVTELTKVRRSKTGKRLRIVCMDPKRDWRALSRYVEPERFRFYSMGNPNFHPLCFNPCKIPRGVIPQIWIDVMIEIYCRAYGLLERGKQLMAETFYSLYEETGIFEVYGTPGWEDKVPELSANVTFEAAYNRMTMYKKAMEDGTSSKGRGGNDTKDAYARLLERLSAFGRPFSIERRLFGDKRGMGIDDLIGADDVTVLESKGLESTFRSFIFGVITAGFYRYAIAQEGGFLAPNQYETVLIIEEANEVLTGSDTAGTSNSQMGLTGQSEFEQILDQSAGYGLFIFAITQKIADMPKSVIANSGLKFAGKIITEDDINVLVKSIGRDPRYDDRDVAKWFPRSPTGWFVCQSSRTKTFMDAEPILVKIAMLPISTPTDKELEAILTRSSSAHAIEAAEQVVKLSVPAT